MSPTSAAAAAPMGLMQCMRNCLGRCCGKGKKTLKPKQSSGVHASYDAAAASASLMNAMPLQPVYMTPPLARQQRKEQISQIKEQRALKKQQGKLEEQRIALEEQRIALEEQQRALDEQKEEITRLDKLTHEMFEKSLPPNVMSFALPPCGLCKKIHNTSNCPSLNEYKQKIEEQQRALEEQQRALE